MGEFEHAGTAKAMPAIKPDEEGAVEVASEGSDAAAAVPLPRCITSEDAGEVAGEILGEPTTKVENPAGADKVAAERGIRPLTRPPIP